MKKFAGICVCLAMIFVFVLISSISLNAAVTYRSKANVSLGTTGTSFTYTTSTGYKRALIFTATLASENPSYAISAVSYAGQAFTKVARVQNGSGGTGTAVELWYLLNPPSGSGTVTITRATGVRMIAGVMEYNGVQVTGASASANNTSSSLSLAVSTLYNRSVISGVYGQRANGFLATTTFYPGTGVTQRYNQSYLSWLSYSLRGAGFDYQAGNAGLHNVSYSSSRSAASAMAGVELRPAPPVVSSLSQSVGYTAGGQAITVYGLNFDNGCTASVGGNSASLTYINSSTLRIVTPAGSAGTVNVTVTNLDGQTASVPFLYSDLPPPSVSSCAPSSGITTGGQTITVNGANFQNGSTVVVGGIASPAVIFLSASQLSVTVPAHGAGSVAVTVTNPDTQSFTLNNAYTYMAPPPEPMYLTPATGLTAGGQSVTVKGRYFVNGCTVRLNGNPASSVTFVSSDTINIITPAGSEGFVDVAVTNPDTQTGTLNNGFRYFASAAPVISGVSPASGTTAGGQVITIAGTGFIDGCAAQIGGVSAAVTFISSTEVRLTTPARSAGTVDIKVINPDTQEGVLPFSYTYAVPPAIISITAASGRLSGGQTITVTGSGFKDGCFVRLGVNDCATNFINSSLITVITEPNTEGAVDAAVYNPDNTSFTLASGFRYDGTLPVIALNGGGSTVTIATGGTFTETATASDDIDGDITAKISKVIVNALGTVVPSVTTSAPATFTITYNVSDNAGNAATELQRTVNVTDQTAPVIDLRGGGSAVTVLAGQPYAEMAIATDNIDGDITGNMIIEIRDSGNAVVGSVSTTVPEVYTITYDVSDAAGNPAVRKTRTVTVIADTLTGLTVLTPPDKTVYEKGEALNTDGLTVQGSLLSGGTVNLFVNELEITGFDSSAAAVGQEITVSKAGQSDTFTVDIIGLNSISVTTPPVKTVYDIGESLDITGLVVTGTYTDTSTEILPVTLSNISGFSSAAAAPSQELTVTFGGFTDTFTVGIVPTLASIAVTTPPLKTVYDIGETLDITGMIVTGTYTDLSTAVLPVYSGHVAGFNSMTAGTARAAVITYDSKTAFFLYDVTPTLVSIAITKPALKLQYRVGDVLDITGLEVTGTYTDGNNKIESIGISDISGFNSTLPADSQLLTITKSGKTASYTVDITQPLLVSIAVTSNPVKTVYYLNETFDRSGLVVTGYFDDLSSSVLVITDEDISGFDSSSVQAGQVLTVEYQGYTDTFTVDIITDAPTVDSCDPEEGVNSGGTSVTVYGSNFQPGCRVYFCGQEAANVAFVDENTITLNTPANSGGYCDVTVVNPDTGSGTGSALFLYTGPTATYTRTALPTRTVTPTVTRTVTQTRTPFVTGTPTFTLTATRTITMTHTVTRTVTQTATQTVTQTITQTITETRTQTVTRTITQTSTITPTSTVTPTITPVPEFAQADAGKSSIFPQPAKDRVTIVYGLDEPALVTIYVYTVSGKPAAQVTVNAEASRENKITINLSKFAPGVYFYYIKAKTQRGGEIIFKPGKFLVAK